MRDGVLLYGASIISMDILHERARLAAIRQKVIIGSDKKPTPKECLLPSITVLRAGLAVERWKLVIKSNEHHPSKVFIGIDY